MHTYTARRRVEFADTDLGGICHFSRFVVFMETAEHLFFEQIGSSVHVEVDGKPVGWPRVSLQVDYKRPARYADLLDIEVRILRKGSKSLTFGHRVLRDGEELASGTMTSVCCVLEEGAVRSIPIPAAIADRIEQAPA
ncbi:hypothetical protein ABI59_19450 [Acidobacteria bacterium Mor1]|nr:hypothetical protein ABI59_19450 [Acidobacteria bacterium Mor1]